MNQTADNTVKPAAPGRPAGLAVLIFTTILTLSALYAPQPLLPVLMAEFGVSREAAAALTTVTFIPLCLAPLFYGYLLESFAALRLLRTAVLLLALSEVAFYLAPEFSQLLTLRLLQGLLVPAILTSLMTQLSTLSRGAQVQRTMAIYIAATILGGFLGRACSGLIATSFGWRTSFLVLAASLLLCFFLLRRLPAATGLSLVRPHRRLVFDVLRQPGVLPLYLMVFGLFFTFAAVMNFLPFRLTELYAEANELRIGLMYSGYAMGIVTSLGAVAVGRWLGGERRAMALGLLVFGIALLGLSAQRVELLFADMFLFCAAMFLVHATASGLVNRLVEGNKGMVNGLYVAFYYGGGTLGSYLPGYAYRYWGWWGFLLVLLGVTALALVCLGRMKSRVATG
ncbi:MFS transporter [Trichloromonas sp.]|uniref:MFS transporter n=1 Tax=Trichloromonas sp. TaxID=3069249 RepID=UPI003D8136B5